MRDELAMNETDLTVDLISINEKPVLKGSIIWFIDHLQSRIDNAIIDCQLIDSFCIKFNNDRATQGCDVVNELLGRILMQDIHHNGFKQITFKGLGSVKNNELDEGLL